MKKTRLETITRGLLWVPLIFMMTVRSSCESSEGNEGYKSVQGENVESTGSMKHARDGFVATKLSDGRVLITGGDNANMVSIAEAEIYNPSSGTMSVAGTMNAARVNHTATLLANGKVLITGGTKHLPVPDPMNPPDQTYEELNSAELYDPATKRFTLLENTLTVHRTQHSAVLLNNGKVLIVGGVDGVNYQTITTAELFDPADNSFTVVSGATLTERYDASAIKLNDGKVLIVGGASGLDELETAVVFNPAGGTNGSFTSVGSMSVTKQKPVLVALIDGRILVLCSTRGYTTTDVVEVYDPVTQNFTATGSLNTARYAASATLLEDGRVLIAGGQDTDANTLDSIELYSVDTGEFTESTKTLKQARHHHEILALNTGKALILGGNSDSGVLKTAELYTPGTRIIQSGEMVHARINHTATRLNDGKVLFVGGSKEAGNTAELYDPETDTFTETGSLNNGRYRHRAALLTDGRVFISGGVQLVGNDEISLQSTEIYDPATGEFSAGPDMSIVRSSHIAITLNNGKVLVAGGPVTAEEWDLATSATKKAELFDPTANSGDGGFSPLPDMPFHSYFSTAVKLSDGKIFITGGRNGGVSFVSVSYTAIFDPNAGDAGEFTLTAYMGSPRRNHTATLLADGNVLITGGYGNSTYYKTAEIYNVAENTFSYTGSLPGAKVSHAAELLSDGQVLVCGGTINNKPDNSNQCFLYSPTKETFNSNGIPMLIDRVTLTLTTLSSGQVLIGGGNASQSNKFAELFY